MVGSFFQNIFQVFFLLGYLLIFVVSIIILKPFRIHRKRPISTITLKVSYLLFLLFFLLFTYLLLFGQKQLSDDEIPYDTLFNIHFLFFLSSTIIPNVGVMIRRSITKKRVVYNMLFSGINLIYATYLLWAISVGKWALL
jgi:hypothetical protein